MTKEAIEQLRKYLAARAQSHEFARNDKIHALHDDHEREAVLRVADLQALLDALAKAQATP